MHLVLHGTIEVMFEGFARILVAETKDKFEIIACIDNNSSDDERNETN